jgi:hypothetical protein
MLLVVFFLNVDGDMETVRHCLHFLINNIQWQAHLYGLAIDLDQLVFWHSALWI